MLEVERHEEKILHPNPTDRGGKLASEENKNYVDELLTIGLRTPVFFILGTLSNFGEEVWL
jgi:hypothetical protein